MSGQQRFYSEDEAQQILHQATRDVTASGMSRDELIRAAGEMGISAEAIERAEADIAAKREAELQTERDARLQREFNRYYRRKIFDHLWSFASTNIVLVGIWFITGADYFWPLWVFGFWGFSMIGDVGNMLFSVSRRDRAYEKWLAKKQGNPASPDAEEDEDSFRRGRRRRWRESRW